MGNFWKYGVAVGAGVALGAVGAMLLCKNSAEVKKAMTNLMSHGLDLKDKAASYMENAKENMEDIAAEARQASKERKGASGKQSA